MRPLLELLVLAGTLVLRLNVAPGPCFSAAASFAQRYHHRSQRHRQQQQRNLRSMWPAFLSGIGGSRGAQLHRRYYFRFNSARSGTCSGGASSAAGPAEQHQAEDSDPKADRREVGSSGAMSSSTSSSSSPTAGTDPPSTTAGPSSPPKSNGQRPLHSPKLDLPWSDVQAWALRDQLPLYTVQVYCEGAGEQDRTIRVCALWRTLASEVTELSGYPIPFLIERHREMVGEEKRQSDPGGSGGSTTMVTTPDDVLPYLDEFEFTNSGGLCGKAYGVAGVADATVIETTPVGNVQMTVPKGFVQTNDGTIYELGHPVREAYSSTASGGGGGRTSAVQSAVSEARQIASKSLLSAATAASDESQQLLASDPELVQLGSLTALLVTGALAFEALSHHLTVNFFWV